ncbi:MAG: pyridoxal-phosphate dependent enzyme [Planctomycetes bacterium]|nr:pyridoxal-phosphate dependent enzyme [Planctomycetota bacterium]
MVTYTDIEQAHQLIRGHIHRTVVLTSQYFDNCTGAQLFFKCENFQKVGAFKFRGACNAILKLPRAKAARGVVTHSSGNHAQALALAAAIRGIEAHVVMPENAPAVKRRAVEDYGATVYPCKPTLAAREEGTARVMETTGAALIPPYNHPDIIAGQGTVALELLAQVEKLDAVVAPVGGGGLISGISIASKGLNPNIRVFAAEPTGADDTARSLAAQRLIPQTNPKTIADGLLTGLGEYTWPIIRDHVERVLTVTDEEIRAAMRLVWERMKILIEPSAAVAVATVLGDAFKSMPEIERVGIVLSGGNVDLDTMRFECASAGESQ